MEIPRPAPEIVISLPRRGKIRVTSIEEADALITAATQAKTMYLAAQAAIAPLGPDDVVDAVIYCGSVAPHSGHSCELADGHDGWHRCGVIVWDGDITARTGEDGAEVLGEYCGAQHPAYEHEQCALLVNHAGPHVAPAGASWEDGDYAQGEHPYPDAPGPDVCQWHGGSGFSGPPCPICAEEGEQADRERTALADAIKNGTPLIVTEDGYPDVAACGEFASPGLTEPDAPSPDACMSCGQPKDAHPASALPDEGQM